MVESKYSKRIKQKSRYSSYKSKKSDNQTKQRFKRYVPDKSKNTIKEYIKQYNDNQNITNENSKQKKIEYLKQIDEQVRQISNEKYELQQIEIRRKKRKHSVSNLTKPLSPTNTSHQITTKNHINQLQIQTTKTSPKTFHSKNSIKPITNKTSPPLTKNLKLNMFDSSDEEKLTKNIQSAPITSKIFHNSINACDDNEGSYIFRSGDLLNNRYKTIGHQGKGVFSSVFLVVDTKNNTQRCVKIIRNNDVMYRTGQRELSVLHKLSSKDPNNRNHIVRFYDTFEHSGHLCIVFESLSMNLRQLLRKCGSTGLNIKAVRSYATQLLKALAFIRRGDLVHADIKPDNILVNDNRNVVKLCDFGSAFDIKSCAITPYLCSRYYRPPEIVLGCEYGFAVDIWSFGCVLFELYSGKILFRGETNNAMILLFIEMFGPIPNKILRKAAFYSDHFDGRGVFLLNRVDEISGGVYKKPLSVLKSSRKILRAMHSSSQQFEDMSEEDKKGVRLLKDLIEKCLRLDPGKRLTPMQALKHPFILNESVKK